MMAERRQNGGTVAFCLVVILNRSILAPNGPQQCRSVWSFGTCHTGIAMNRLILCLFVLPGVTGLSIQVEAQETEAATRQYAVAVGFQNQKLFDDAIAEWKTFLRKYPKDPRVERANHYLGTCCLQESRFTEAIRALKLVTSKDFELLDQTLLNRGIAWYGQAGKSKSADDYEQAEEALGQMLTQFPKSKYVPRALYYRGESLYQLKQSQEAAAAFAKLSNTYADHELAADALYALGTIYEERSNPEEALKAFQTFSTKYPAHELVTEVQMRRAQILFDAGEYASASPVFARVSRDTDFRMADVAMVRHARCLYEQGQLTEAARLYLEVPRQFRRSKHQNAALLAGSKCYFLDGKYSLARSGFEQLLNRRGPEAAEAVQWLARSWLKEGDAEQALKVSESGLRKYEGRSASVGLQLVRIDAMYEIPQQKKRVPRLYELFARQNATHESAPQAQYMAALASLELGNHEEARAYCGTFLASFAASELKPDVLFIAAESELLTGRYEKAAQRYEAYLQSAAQHPNRQQATVRYGLALQLSKDHQQAIRWLQDNQVKTPALRSQQLGIIGRSHSALKNWEQAAESLKQSIAVYPTAKENDETYVALAEAYRKLGQEELADQQLRQVLTSFPNSRFAAEAAFRLAEASYAAERFPEAVSRYQVVVDKFPKSEFAPHARYGLGWTEFSLGNFDRASQIMSDLAQRHPDSDPAKKAYYVRAMAAYQLQQFAESLQHVESYLKTQPAGADALDALYVKGLAQAGLNKFGDAAATYQSILTSAKDLTNGYPAADKVSYELGWAWAELGDTKRAVAAFSNLARDYPQSPLAAESQFRVGESWYEAGDYEKSAAAYQDAAAKAENGEIAEKALHKLGWSQLKSNNPASAQQTFALQIQKHANGELAGDARFLIGECLFKAQEWKKALVIFQEVASRKNSGYTALASFRTGECAASLEDWTASQRWHEKVLSDFPDFEMQAEARYGLGWALQNQGEYRQAMQLYELVTEQTQTETAAKARFMMGESCFAMKEHKEATRHFLKAAFVYNHPKWSAMAWFEAARCFEVLRDVEQAVSCYEKMVEKYPQHSRVPDARRRLTALSK